LGWMVCFMVFCYCYFHIGLFYGRLVVIEPISPFWFVATRTTWTLKATIFTGSIRIRLWNRRSWVRISRGKLFKLWLWTKRCFLKAKVTHFSARIHIFFYISHTVHWRDWITPWDPSSAQGDYGTT
jgi:hypothetical protein